YPEVGQLRPAAGRLEEPANNSIWRAANLAAEKRTSTDDRSGSTVPPPSYSSDSRDRDLRRTSAAQVPRSGYQVPADFASQSTIDRDAAALSELHPYVGDSWLDQINNDSFSACRNARQDNRNHHAQWQNCRRAPHSQTRRGSLVLSQVQ